jgi:hypothetical protein
MDRFKQRGSQGQEHLEIGPAKASGGPNITPYPSAGSVPKFLAQTPDSVQKSGQNTAQIAKVFHEKTRLTNSKGHVQTTGEGGKASKGTGSSRNTGSHKGRSRRVWQHWLGEEGRRPRENGGVGRCGGRAWFGHKPVPGEKKNRCPRSTGVRAARARCSLIEKGDRVPVFFYRLERDYKMHGQR